MERSHVERLPSLDGIRAISICMVLFAHASVTVGFPLELTKRAALFLDGQLGVRFFFVISGFLITTLLIRESKETGAISLSAFYTRRALRILPVYYFYIVVTLLIGIVAVKPMAMSTVGSAATFSTQIWGVWNSPGSWLLEHTWSLSMEEQFYLVWPAMLAFLGVRLPGKIWVPALLIAAPILRYLMWNKPLLVGHIFFFQGDSIAAGSLLGILIDRRRSELQKLFEFHRTTLRIVAFGLVYQHIILASLFNRCHIPWPVRLSTSLTYSVQCVSIAYLIGSFVVVRKGIGYSFLNNGALQWIGRLSYSLYIWQEITLVPAVSLILLPNWKAVQWMTRFPQNLFIAFALACASYYCLELPMLKLKGRFSRVGMLKTTRHVDQIRGKPAYNAGYNANDYSQQGQL